MSVLAALVPGATVWLVIAASGVGWLIAVAVATATSRGTLFGPRHVVRWWLRAWLPRLMILAFWGVAGWHVFCQRP
jgi:hypothetical protein